MAMTNNHDQTVAMKTNRTAMKGSQASEWVLGCRERAYMLDARPGNEKDGKHTFPETNQSHLRIDGCNSTLSFLGCHLLGATC